MLIVVIADAVAVVAVPVVADPVSAAMSVAHSSLVNVLEDPRRLAKATCRPAFIALLIAA